MDPAAPGATAVAVRDGMFVAVGTDEEIGASSRPGDYSTDLQGRLVIPGLVDAHIHLLGYAQARHRLDLTPARDLEDALAVVRARAAETPAGEWIVGRGWNQNRWPGHAFPTASDLDRAAKENPVYLIAHSGHAGWANSLALEIAGVTYERPDPPGGVIQRTGDRQPTGILFEEAMQFLDDAAGSPTPAEAARMIRQALPSLWEVGITGVHCVDGQIAFQAAQLLHQKGELGLRLVKYLPVSQLDHAIGAELCSGLGDDWLWIGGIKLFADGALGVQTAALSGPYEGELENLGLMVLEPEEMMDIGRRASAAGLSLAIHAIGDRANRAVLDLYQALPRPVGGQGCPAVPNRIEHVQLLDLSDVRRFAELGVTASMQPIHATSDMEMAERLWGQRTATSYAWRSLLENGAGLAFGSDAPLEPVDPLLGIHAAVTRRRLDGTPGLDGWHPEQRITVHQAVSAYTIGPARAAGLGAKLGSISPGKLADLVVLDRDVFAIDPMEIPSARVVGVMIGGEWVKGPET
jgi:hypothetical protein